MYKARTDQEMSGPPCYLTITLRQILTHSGPTSSARIAVQHSSSVRALTGA